MDRIEKPDDSSLELLRHVLKGVLVLEQDKSKQTFANLKNGLKRAEAQKLIPRGVQELVRKETSSLFRETQENKMTENENITMKAEDFVAYIEQEDGFDELDFVELFCNGDSDKAAKFLESRETSKVNIVGEVVFPSKTFTRSVELSKISFEKISFGKAIFEHEVSLYVFNRCDVKIFELRFDSAVFKQPCMISVAFAKKILFESAIFHKGCQIGDGGWLYDTEIQSIDFGQATIKGCLRVEVGTIGDFDFRNASFLTNRRAVGWNEICVTSEFIKNFDCCEMKSELPMYIHVSTIKRCSCTHLAKLNKAVTFEDNSIVSGQVVAKYACGQDRWLIE